MHRYVSPNGYFGLDYPSEFSLTEAEDITLIEAPSKLSCLSVSTHNFDRDLSADHFITLFQKLTAHYEAIQEPYYLNEVLLIQRFKTVKPNNEGDVVTTFWTVCIKREMNYVVVISINVNSEEDIKTYQAYERIMDSVLSSEPLSPKRQ